jgi:hypothetical protein
MKLEDIRGMKQNMHAVFDTPQGKEVINFLELIAGWYDFNDTAEELVLTKNGRRQILATIKTFLKQSPEQISALAQLKENDNG